MFIETPDVPKMDFQGKWIEFGAFENLFNAGKHICKNGVSNNILKSWGKNVAPNTLTILIIVAGAAENKRSIKSIKLVLFKPPPPLTSFYLALSRITKFDYVQTIRSFFAKHGGWMIVQSTMTKEHKGTITQDRFLNHRHLKLRFFSIDRFQTQQK